MPDFDLDAALVADDDSWIREMPDQLRPFAELGHLSLSARRPDGTLELCINDDPPHPDQDSKLVWHPDGAEQDYEGMAFYVETEFCRGGDWHDPLGSELAECGNTLDDLVFWLVEQFHP